MQSSKNILLVRPSTFSFNKETAASNAFQVELTQSNEEIREKKLQEFDAFVSTLRLNNVNVFVFDDTVSPEKPDAIFPNNWVTFHADGTVILYPMFAKNRQQERREDLIHSLEKNFIVKQVLDLSKYEKEHKYLEGTGSMVFDHVHKIAYACLSPRTDKALFLEVCNSLNYQPVYFYAHDENGKAIYHTNVMMCISEQFSVICLDTIKDERERNLVVSSLEGTGHQVIAISFEQMNKFAGNMLTLQTNDGKNILALSQSASESLTAIQKSEIEKYNTLVPLSIKTIETIGGGSARCMIAEVFLPLIVE